MSDAADVRAPQVRRVRSKWRDSLLICRKCTKKVRGGFGKKGRKSLVKVLTRALDGGRDRRASIGVIEVGCMKLCPKKAVTVARGTLPGTLFAVPEGLDVEAVVIELGLPLPV